ncbi:MAG: energy-dependent translational throttle protein EttA [Bacteroidales bacterium]|jgi:ATP-binding cassette ChvD family protein|nr:energy-dependent translational throttle protein EttA [Bacteroidales bacterium]MBQ2395616.1 energy-dependent translational throttle protein EttA [Bacteroidales bacterium]MBQ5872788.1 energy-dependent translational throttle protein EttA [Bacteroidales bacterium]MBQ5892206.1 energy-dependent translational throttle protein EttA [Bacteroidales bacterium]MEE0267961.1 energy-dependent translational throttle protein EttA [Bacteroidales bacterium]
MAQDDKKIIFSMVGVGKLIPPSRQILKDIYLSFYYGAKIGIIGLNGSGKSTLLKIIAGLDKSHQGEVHFSPGYSVGYLEQEPQLDDTKTVKEIVLEGVKEVADLIAEYEEVNMKFCEPMSDEEMAKLIERQGELTELMEQHDAWNLDNKLERAMDALRCPPDDALVKNLSGGERRRVALCRILLQEPDILLLDEPTNHLDAESIEWLELHLQQYKGTVIAVTHDRYFLDNVAGWILELDRGEGIPWQGNYSSWLDQKTKRLEMEEKQESKRRKTLQRELEWVRMSPKARQAKGKARLSSYEQMMNQDVKEKEEKLEIFIPNGPRLGDKVIEVNSISKAYGDKLLFENLSFSLPPAGIVGVIGPNGAGKTTLFRMIMGLETPDTGSFDVGPTVKVGYVDQQHQAIDPEKNVWEVVSEGNEQISLGGKLVNSRAYVSRFNFSGTDQNKKTGILSGGERNRLHLALTLKSEANVLLLDEPTNDIDVNTLRALEEGLENFAGCAVVISHDRWFLDRIATHILAFEGDSQVYFFEGSYSEYEENKKKRLGDTTPKRMRYKKLISD